MLMIAHLVDDMKEELHTAKKYYKEAQMLKEKQPDLARKYVELAKVELSHALVLHSIAVDLVSRYDEKATEEMKEYYDDAHEYYIEKYDKLSYLLNRF